MTLRALAIASVFALAGPVLAQPSAEGPYFIYLGSFTSKGAAQAQARVLDGWVLRTDLYRGLTPGFFAVVRGPFRTREDAEAALPRARAVQPEALVRHAGPPALPPALGDAGLLAAVLGDLTVAVSDSVATRNPCAPNEPHLTVLVGFASELVPQRGDRPAAGFWLLERTGEVVPIRVCGE